MKPHCLYWVYFAGGQVFIMGVFTFFSHVISQLSFISILFHVCPFDEILLTSHVNCLLFMCHYFLLHYDDVWCFFPTFFYCHFMMHFISVVFWILLIFAHLSNINTFWDFVNFLKACALGWFPEMQHCKDAIDFELPLR